MELMKVVLGLCLLLGSMTVSAQQNIFERLEENRAGEGTVIIHQDSRLKSLVGQTKAYSESQVGHKPQKVTGFRVQVYAGNNSQNARTEALRIGEEVKKLFPELEVYTQFISPRWICRIGDYRSIEEADVVMRQLKATGDFKELSIVRSIVNL